MESKFKYEFKYTFPGGSTLKTLEGEFIWIEILEEFVEFLRGCGYILPSKKINDIIEALEAEEEYE